jgi:hypothetical protein
MRNIWKGLIVGGLTGAGAGIALDVLGRAAQLVGIAGKRAAYMAPEAADRVKSAVNAGVTQIREADIGDKVRDRATGTVEKVIATEQADQARAALGQATKKARRLAHSVTAPNGSIG